MAQEQLTLRNISLQFINRILNPNFENKAIWAFITSGLIFVAYSQALIYEGEVQITLSFLQAQLHLNDSPSWIPLSIGLALLSYGGLALYKIKISPPIKRRDEIERLSQMLIAHTSSNNALIQEDFYKLFKIRASVPIIRYILNSIDPNTLIRDFRYGGNLVKFAESHFELDPPINLEQRWKFYSWVYYALSTCSIAIMAGPFYPFINDPITKQNLSIFGFPIAIIIGIFAALVLDPIRSLSAAKRLIKSIPQTTLEPSSDAASQTPLISDCNQ